SLCCPTDHSDVVDDFGCGQNIDCQQLLEFLPVNRTLAATPTQPVPPRLLRIATDVLQQREVASNPVVPKVPASLHAQHPILVLQRRMTIVATPLPQRLLGTPEPFPGCAAFDDPKPPTCSCPVMGEAEKLECAVPMCRCLTGFGLPEYDQRRLRWMHTQAKAGKPRW